jgi:hypothetical protein
LVLAFLNLIISIIILIFLDLFCILSPDLVAVQASFVCNTRRVENDPLFSKVRILLLFKKLFHQARIGTFIDGFFLESLGYRWEPQVFFSLEFFSGFSDISGLLFAWFNVLIVEVGANLFRKFSQELPGKLGWIIVHLIIR